MWSRRGDAGHWELRCELELKGDEVRRLFEAWEREDLASDFAAGVLRGFI